MDLMALVVYKGIARRVLLPISSEELAERFGYEGEELEVTFDSIESLPTLDCEHLTLDLANKLAKNLKDVDKDLVLSHIESQSPNVSDLLKFNFHDCSLYSDITTDHELGAYMVANNGFNLGLILKYLDYEKYGRDVRLEEGGSFTDRGYFLPKANRL